MRTSVNLPDETIATVRDLAAADGITPAEWMRRAILEAVTPRHPAEHPAGTPGNTPDEAPISARDGPITRADILASDLDTMTAERDQAREDLGAERVRVQVLEAEAKKDAEHIKSLQSAIATVAAGARPALDTAADQDRPRRRPDYCIQPGTTCEECSLNNYGRDCRNVPLDDRATDKYVS